MAKRACSEVSQPKPATAPTDQPWPNGWAIQISHRAVQRLVLVVHVGGYRGLVHAVGQPECADAAGETEIQLVDGRTPGGKLGAGVLPTLSGGVQSTHFNGALHARAEPRANEVVG